MRLARAGRADQRQRPVRPSRPGVELAQGLRIGRRDDEGLAPIVFAAIQLQAELTGQGLNPNYFADFGPLAYQASASASTLELKGAPD
jgi:hypothetical protein